MKPRVKSAPAKDDQLPDTWSALAEKLEFDRRSFARWRKLPGAPVEPDEEQWVAFIADQGLGKGVTSELSAMKVLIAEQELQRKVRQNEVEAGRMIHEKEVQDFLRDWAAQLDQILVSEFVTNATPQVVGKSVTEVRLRMQEGLTRVREATKRGLLNWNAEDNQQTA